MKKNKLTCWSPHQRPTLLLLALSALVGFTAGLNPCSAWADQNSKEHDQTHKLVPYTGVVKGQLVVDAFLTPVAAPPAQVASHPLGKGLQLYDLAATTVTPIYIPGYADPVGLTTSGSGVTVTGKGDQLRLCYTLTGYFNPANPAELLYTGTYSVLPGGTGRFEYDDDDDLPAGGFGSGLIEGAALIIPDPATGNLTLDFAHVFDGDLLLGKPEKHDDDKDKDHKKKDKDHDEDHD